MFVSKIALLKFSAISALFNYYYPKKSGKFFFAETSLTEVIHTGVP